MKKSLKKIGNANPVMTQRFGADPYAMVYEDRVYLYMTGDDFIYDETGEIKENNYSNIYTINVISSSDLVNWKRLCGFGEGRGILGNQLMGAGGSLQGNRWKNEIFPVFCKWWKRNCSAQFRQSDRSVHRSNPEAVSFQGNARLCVGNLAV